MNRMRDYVQIAQHDAWAKHLRKMCQDRENAQFFTTETGKARRRDNGLSPQRKRRLA